MLTRSPAPRAWMLLVLSALALSATAQQCPFGPPPPVVTPTTVDIDLVNEAFDAVDPGLFVDGFFFDAGLIAPGDFVPLVADCGIGTTLQTDAILVTSLGDVLSDNFPLVQEGVDFLCGDLVSFVFIEDEFGFHTQVEVNGELIVP